MQPGSLSELQSVSEAHWGGSTRATPSGGVGPRALDGNGASQGAVGWGAEATRGKYPGSDQGAVARGAGCKMRD